MAAIKKDNPVVILAGGLGTRLREETEFRPKPMVPIGGKPIIWHIMKIFSHYGFNKFIICLGYKGGMIKEYFLNQKFRDVDFTVNTRTGRVSEISNKQEEWEVTLVDTGLENQTGSRIAQIAPYVATNEFLLTYGDGVGNVNIADLFAFHLSHKKLGTLTAVYPPLRFGHLNLNGDVVQAFKEKRRFKKDWINGGFCVFNKEILSLCSKQKDFIFEQSVLPHLADTGELMAYKHDDFWYCMDTIRDKEYLEQLWKDNPQWRVWKNVLNPAVMMNNSTITELSG